MKQIKLRGNENILIVRPDRIGDLVLTLPLASVLKKIYRNVKIDYLVSSYNYPLLKYAGYIDGHLLLDNYRSNRKTVAELTTEMEQKKYDIAIFAKPGLFTAFCSHLAGIPLRLGTLRRAYSFLFNIRMNTPRRYSNMHELDLNLKLLQPLGISPEEGSMRPSLEIPDSLQAEIREMAGIGQYILIHPGSKGSAPNWPINYYVDLIEKLSAKTTVVVSGQGDNHFAGAANVINLINKTDFEGLINVLSRAKLFISGSTGPIHVAAALGTPVVGFYPDHSVLGAHRWAPRGKSVTIISPEKQKGHVCRIKDNGSCSCLESIRPEFIYDKILELMAA